MKIKLLASLVLFACTMAVPAQTTFFTYQGRLNTNGVPANGNYDLRFRLLDGLSVLVAGPVTNAPVFVTNGLFSVLLNFGSGVFTSSDRWLEIGVRTFGSTNAYTVLSPVQPLTSTPYAIQSINAQNAGAAVALTAPMQATNLTGTLPDELLSANVPLLSGGATFSGAVSASQFNGSGAGLFNVPTTSLTGTLPDPRLSANVPLLNANQNFNGTLTATQFVGNGYGLTNVPGAFFWISVAGNSVNAFPNTGYLATGDVTPLTVTLPASPRVGDMYRVAGVGGAGWILAQNAGQSIYCGNLSQNVGWNWTPRASPQNWYSVASSADGTKLVAVANGDHPYTSTDSGANWIQRDISTKRNWTSVASSADGTKLVATVANYLIYTSTDSGATWTPRASSSLNWKSIASSADGTKLVAVVYGGQIYTSTDSGGSWSTPRASSQYWKSVASSADGTKLVAVVEGEHPYTSTDSGVTWVQRDSNSDFRSWSAVASSYDGYRLVAAVNVGQIYFSNDAGTNWMPTANFNSLPWNSICSSADGMRLAAVNGPNGSIDTSTDEGATWGQRFAAPVLSWSSIASSADGSKLVAVASGDKIYTSSVASTTVGTSGYLSGAQQSAIEIQYIGNNRFMPLSHEGAIVPH